jgi:uncharacterized protein (DUF2267 family)
MPKRTSMPKPSGAETDPYSAAFFEALESSGHLPRGATPPEAAAGVLGVMLLRLAADEAKGFVEELPDSLRALLRPFALERDTDPVQFGREGFLSLVAKQFGIDAAAALRLSRVVFAALEYELPVEQQVEQVERMLPSDLRDLWRQDTRGA